MPTPPVEPATDARLVTLLDVERRLEARVRERELAAQQRVDAARAERDAARSRVPPDLDAAIAAEEAEDEAGHRAALQGIADARQVALRALDQVSDETVERLARLALRRALGAP